MLEEFLQRSAGAYRRPWPILVAAAIVTAVLAGGIPRLTVDNDIKSMLPKTDRTRALTELYDGESNFGSSNAVFIGVEAADVYSLDTLRYIKKLQDEISDLDRSLPVRQMARLLRLSPEESAKVMDDLRSVGINDLNYGETLVPLLGSSEALRKRFGWDAGLADKVARNAAGVPGERLFGAYESPLGQIQSLVNGDYIAYEDDALVAKKLVDGGLPTAESVAGLKERVESWDTYEGVLVSKDGKLAAITVTIRTEDKDVKAMLNADLQRISADPPPGIEVFVAGEPVIVDHLANVIAKDLPLLTPLMALVLVAILFLCFGSAQGVFYPLLVTLLSVIWTFGLMGYLGLPLTIVSSTMPVLLMAIVSAYGIHQMNHYYEDRRTGKFEVLRHNARSVGLAILLSGLSVMIGFGSMITLDFVPIRNFGILTAFGDLVGVLAALYVLPALLMLGSPEKKGRKYIPEDEKRDLIARLLRRVKDLGRKRPGRVLAVAGLAALVLVIGATMARSDLDLTKFFPPGDSVRVADRVLNERMAGTKSLSVVLDTDLREPLTRKGNPDSLVELTSSRDSQEGGRLRRGRQGRLSQRDEGLLLRRRPQEDEPGDERRRSRGLRHPRRRLAHRPVPRDLLRRHEDPAHRQSRQAADHDDHERGEPGRHPQDSPLRPVLFRPELPGPQPSPGPGRRRAADLLRVEPEPPQGHDGGHLRLRGDRLPPPALFPSRFPDEPRGRGAGPPLPRRRLRLPRILGARPSTRRPPSFPR